MVGIGSIAKIVFLIGGGYILYRAIEGFGRGGGFTAPGRIGVGIGQIGSSLADVIEAIPKAISDATSGLYSVFTTGVGTPGCKTRPAFQPCPSGTIEKTDG